MPRIGAGHVRAPRMVVLELRQRGRVVLPRLLHAPVAIARDRIVRVQRERALERGRRAGGCRCARAGAIPRATAGTPPRASRSGARRRCSVAVAAHVVRIGRPARRDRGAVCVHRRRPRRRSDRTPRRAAGRRAAATPYGAAGRSAITACSISIASSVWCSTSSCCAMPEPRLHLAQHRARSRAARAPRPAATARSPGWR